MNHPQTTPLNPLVLKLFLLAVGIVILVGVALLGYAEYQKQAAQAAQTAAQATRVAIANEAALAQATATEGAAEAQATALEGQQEAAATATETTQEQQDAFAAAQANSAATAQGQATATAQAFVDQGTALAALPAGQCVVGMPDHDMRLAVSGNGAEQLCQNLVQFPISGPGPVADYTRYDTYNPTDISLSLQDGTQLSVVCQYNLPRTIVRVFDDGLTKQYGTAICSNTQIDGVSAISVG